MKYLFDSNTVSDLYDTKSNHHISITEKISSLGDTDSISISIVTLYELEYAYCNAPDNKKEIIRNDINHLKSHFEIVPLSLVSSGMFGLLKKKFKDSRMISKENIKKHNIDIMLASCAICENYILISADGIYQDLKQFSDRLYLENWTV
jgi:predicted nucleic acid-binding protein